MSKKYLSMLSLAYVCATMSPSQADAATFNGAYVGASTGWMHKKVDVNVKDSGGIKTKHGFNNLPLIAHLGYVSSAPNSFLWAIEAGLGWTFLNKKVKLIEGTGKYAGQNVSGKIEYELKSKLYSELAFKLGWNFDDQYALYGIGGISYQNVEHKITATVQSPALSGKFTESLKDNIFGVFPGIGGAVKLADNWVVRGEYKYHFQKSVAAVASGEKVKIGTHDVRIALDYAF